MRIPVILLLLISSCAVGQAPKDSAPLKWTPTDVPGVLSAAPAGQANTLYLCTRTPRELPKHKHPTKTTLTVLKGQVSVTQSGAASRTLKQLESMTIPAGQEHSMLLGKHSRVKIVSDGQFAWGWSDPDAVKALGKQTQVDSASERTKQKQQQDKR